MHLLFRVVLYVAALSVTSVTSACKTAKGSSAALTDEVVAESTTGRIRFDEVYRCTGTSCQVECFNTNRGRLPLAVYVYKSAEAPVRPEPVNLRTTVTYPPNFDPATQRAPAIAFFHGGGLAEGSPMYWQAAAFYFASRGFVAATFQYRLRSVHQSTPEQSVADALSAIKWLRVNAAELGVDPGRIVTAGDSAGGLLALLTSFNPQVADDGVDVSAAATVMSAAYPMVDVALARWGPEISPVALRKPDNHSLIVHGDADRHPWTPFATSRTFCAGLSGCRFVAVAGEDHAFLSKTERFDEFVTHLDRLLIQRGIITGDVDQVRSWVASAKSYCHFQPQNYAAWNSDFGYADGGGLW